MKKCECEMCRLVRSFVQIERDDPDIEMTYTAYSNGGDIHSGFKPGHIHMIIGSKSKVTHASYQPETSSGELKTVQTIIGVMTREEFNAWISKDVGSSNSLVGKIRDLNKINNDVGFVITHKVKDANLPLSNPIMFYALPQYREYVMSHSSTDEQEKEWELSTFDFNIAHQLMQRGYSVTCDSTPSNMIYSYCDKHHGRCRSNPVIIVSWKDSDCRQEIVGFTTNHIMSQWRLV